MQILASSYISCISCVFIFSFVILRFIDKKWCHASTQPLLYCSKLMHNKQSCGRWKAWHHGCWCITAVVCLSCACFGKEVGFLGIFHFFNLLLVLSWTSNWLLLLISVPVSGVMNHTWKACCYSRKMASSLVAVEKIREIGVLWETGAWKQTCFAEPFQRLLSQGEMSTVQ